MEVQQDFRDLLALFNKHKVDYIIAHDLALVCVDLEAPNLAQVEQALESALAEPA